MLGHLVYSAVLQGHDLMLKTSYCKNSFWYCIMKTEGSRKCTIPWYEWISSMKVSGGQILGGILNGHHPEEDVKLL
jgi:hypothetical protein